MSEQAVGAALLQDSQNAKLIVDKLRTEAGLTYLPPDESLWMSHTPPARLTGFNRWWTDGTVGKL